MTNLENFISQNSEPNEIWKNIPNYEDLYMISTHGRIIAKEKYVSNRYKNVLKPVRFLKINIDDNRKKITLAKDGKSQKFSILKLMAEVFLPKPDDNYILKFKDNNPLNCNLDNLIWMHKIDRHTKFVIDNLEGEVWKDVPGYEGYYSVSNKGRIISLSRNIITSNRIIHTQDRLMELTPNVYGYLYITLSKQGKYKKHMVHRLVAMAFIDNPNNYPHIDHIDTNITNNAVENLRWVTPSLNMQNELTKKHVSEGLKNKHNRSWNCTPIVQLRDNILIKTYPSIAEAERNGFGYSGIQKCLYGKQKTHKGYKWMYLSEYNDLTPEGISTPASIPVI